MRPDHFRFKNRKIFLKYLFCLFLALTAVAGRAHAQDILRSDDLSNVQVDNLSDADIAKFQAQLQASGMTMAQAEQVALSKKMPAAEFNKLKERVAKLGGNPGSTPTTPTKDSGTSRQTIKNDYKTSPKKPSDSNVFGSSFFSTTSLSFEPNLRIATPGNYVLGPDDEITINLTGYQEAAIRVKVQPEGIINIPQVGQVDVTGLSIEAATARIRDRMTKTAYPNLANGLTKLTVSLGAIRSIHITIIGAAKPGNFTVSSLTTLFNALYVSGGPDDINSYREIELRRGGKVIRKIDLYQFLTRGDESGNVLLKDNDVINIPVYKKRVAIVGEVKRPGVFELLENESTNDLLFYAGGLTDRAYTANISVRQVTDRERRIRDLGKDDFASYKLNNGDSISVGTILARLDNSVSIQGAVYRPGQFELSQGLTISGLIKKADGVREDAFLRRAILTRTFSDRHKENISFNVSQVLNDGIGDIPLYKGDEIQIASSTDFRTEYTVTIEGEVRKPGSFPYKTNITLKDILFASGNFTDAGSPYRIEISRRINNLLTQVPDSIAQVFTIDTDSDLAISQNQFLLEPFDMITVRKKPGYLEQRRVTIKGEVVYPGMYTIQKKTDRISDLIKRAGGFTPSSFFPGVSLERTTVDAGGLQENKIQTAQLLQRSIRDTSSKILEDVSKDNVKIPLDINKILSEPGSREDYILQEGDIIDVPVVDPLVKISGEVFLATKTGFEPNSSLYYYLNRAGGVTDNARRSRIYVLYANGRVGKTRHGFFGLFKSYPEVKPGAEIVVPRKLERRRLSAAETIGLGTAFLSLISLLIVTISTLSR